MKFRTDIHSPQRMNPTDVGDSLTFISVPPTDQRFHLSEEETKIILSLGTSNMFHSFFTTCPISQVSLLDLLAHSGILLAPVKSEIIIINHAYKCEISPH